MEGIYKAAKGLIRINVETDTKEKIIKIQIAGDFFMYPEDKLWDLEKALIGSKMNKDEILSKIKAFYEETNVLTPGVIPEDFTEAIVRAVTNPSTM